MNKRWLQLISSIFLFIFCFGSLPNTLLAQNDDGDEFEVYLDFRHRGVVSSVVISYYKNDEFYLPVSELFSLFNIDHTVNGLVIDGNFGVEQTPYSIDFQGNQIRFGDEVTEINADDYLIKELDSYLRADLFYEAFELDFSIDFNNLTLHLETDRELPAIEQAIRRQRRQVADRNRLRDERYDVRYERERPFLDGGFLDYNLSANISSNRNIYNYNTNIGLQVYGGDLQGSLFGSYSDSFSSFSTNNLRWRYMFRDQDWLSELTIGQTTTDGFTRNAYTGIRLSNEPIEPRRLFDEFEVQGNTIPQSEVELFLNNALIDFQQADELGNYRFLTPITYGSSQLDLRIYGPTGQIIERSSRIQVPFTFQPEGVFNYTINAGRLDNPLFGSTQQNLTAQGSGAYGITNWLTAKAGVEYYEEIHDEAPTFTGALSSRIMSNYILTFEAASQAYYRGIINAIYPNSASINIDYTDFTSGLGVYNPSNDDKRLVASVFYPFQFGNLPLNLRASTFSRIRPTSSTTTFRIDANSRIGKLNLRLGYSDRFLDEIDLFDPSSSAYFEGSATYNISRNRNVPSYLRGVFLRTSMRYQPAFSQVESTEFLISQNVFQKGRLQLSFGRNFLREFNTLRFSLVVDFDKVRTSSTYNDIRGNSNFTQNVRGSIGYDTNYNNFLFTSRDQVGRSGAAIQLFVDNNADGVYNEGDDAISENAVRVQRSGAQTMEKNGVLYYTQMNSYYHYNMEMNKGAIRNPMLVPDFENFGLITDPNRFKKIEIPFYMSGVVEGLVQRLYPDDRRSGIGGLKLTLEGKDNDFSEELRTFSDGGFYSYEVPPGEYLLKIDQGNLDQLGVRSDPEEIEFEVEALPDGDFVEGLTFELIPTGMTREDLQKIADASEETTPQAEADTSDTVELPDNISVPDTSVTNVVSEDQITEAVSDTLSQEELTGDQGDDQQGADDQDGVDTGLPPVTLPPVLPLTDVADLDADADSAQTDSLPDTTITDPIADVQDDPDQTPDSTTTEIDDLTDIPADSTIATIDEGTDDPVQPEDSLGVEPDAAIDEVVLPPVVTTPVLADIADADSTVTEIDDQTNIPADSTIAAVEEGIDDGEDEVAQPEDSLGVEPDAAIDGVVLPPVVTTPVLADSDSVDVSAADSTIAEKQPDTELPADSADFDQKTTDDGGMIIAPPAVPTATDGIPTAFSSNEDTESLTPGACIYGIQFASYSRESQANNLSRRLEDEYLTFTVYNTPYELYALREIQYQSLARVTSATRELNSSYNFDAAVISQCYADLDLNPETASYYIQIGEFATEEKAQTYLQELTENKGITATEIPGDRSEIQVGIGPFRSESQAAGRLDELRGELDNYPNASVRRYVPPAKIMDLSFEFLLMFDEFTTEEQALAFGQQVENDLSMRTKVLQDENKETYMVTTELMKDWARINNLKDDVVNSGLSEQPVILMLEIKN